MLLRVIKSQTHAAMKAERQNGTVGHSSASPVSLNSLQMLLALVVMLQPSACAEPLPADPSADASVARSLRGKYMEAMNSWAVQPGRTLEQMSASPVNAADIAKADAGAGIGTDLAKPPSHFTARVIFNGTFPGPGAVTYRDMVSYWIYGDGHERFTSLVLMRALSSAPAVSSSTVYDSVTMDKEYLETKLDVWKGVPGECLRGEPVQRLVNTSRSFSICRFCPTAWRRWGAFPNTLLTKGSDDTLAIEGAPLDCETYGWTGDFGARHKIWISKRTGLVVKELQQQAGGPTTPYPASAEITIAYDVLLPKQLFGMEPMKHDLFTPPTGCDPQVSDG